MMPNEPTPKESLQGMSAAWSTFKTAIDRTSRFIFPFHRWLEQGLQKLGHYWWRRISETDPRRAWRWLIANWAKLGAWWLIAGLVLTAVFLSWCAYKGVGVVTGMAIISMTTIAQALFGSSETFSYSQYATVLALPILLPGVVIITIAGVVIGVFLLVLGPPLFIGFIIVNILASITLLSQGSSWLVHFVGDWLRNSDQEKSYIHTVRKALGFGSSTTDDEGKARMLEGDELARYESENHQAKEGAPILLGNVEGRKFVYWTQKHVYLTASSRAGKGRDLIIPNLRLYPESVFVLDPKGENCIATAKEREAKGNRIAVFDPYGLSGRPTARFNPLENLAKNGLVRGADYLAEALIVGKDDHWTESARGLIRALVLYVLTATEEELGETTRDLPTLRRILTGSLDEALETMVESRALDGLVSRLAISITSIPDNEKGSIVSTARRGTKWLDNPELADLFSAGENCISLDDLRDPSKRLSVFVCLPTDVFSTYPQVCRLITTFALDTMMRALTDRKRPVMFILDELAQLHHLPIVEKAFTLGAGYGLQVWAIFQSIAQAKKLYPLDALYGSSGFRGFFKIEDTESCEYASKAASGVLTPDNVRHMPPFGMLALLEGTNPLFVERLGAQMARR